MAPEVSVVIPTHNRVRLLELTLKSALWQEGVDFEVIVVDDGSTDDTSTAAGLDDLRVRLVRNDSPQGVSAARNRGISAARGRWIAFLDDDDLWAPDKLALQLEAARQAGRHWAYAGAVKIDSDHRVIAGTPPEPPELVWHRLPYSNLVPGGCSGVIATSEVLDTTGGFDRRLVNMADWDLWIRLGRVGPPGWVPSPLVAYRVHSGNASQNTRLVLAEMDLMDGRYGVAVDRGAMHHYLAWVCLRSGKRARSAEHFVRAALGGKAGPAARDLVAILRRRLARRLPSAGFLHPRETQYSRWREGADRWLAELGLGSAHLSVSRAREPTSGPPPTSPDEDGRRGGAAGREPT